MKQLYLKAVVLTAWLATLLVALPAQGQRIKFALDTSISEEDREVLLNSNYKLFVVTETTSALSSPTKRSFGDNFSLSRSTTYHYYFTSSLTTRVVSGSFTADDFSNQSNTIYINPIEGMQRITVEPTINFNGDTIPSKLYVVRDSFNVSPNFDLPYNVVPLYDCYYSDDLSLSSNSKPCSAAIYVGTGEKLSYVVVPLDDSISCGTYRVSNYWLNDDGQLESPYYYESTMRNTTYLPYVNSITVDETTTSLRTDYSKGQKLRITVHDRQGKRVNSLFEGTLQNVYRWMNNGEELLASGKTRYDYMRVTSYLNTVAKQDASEGYAYYEAYALPGKYYFWTESLFDRTAEGYDFTGCGSSQSFHVEVTAGGTGEQEVALDYSKFIPVKVRYKGVETTSTPKPSYYVLDNPDGDFGLFETKDGYFGYEYSVTHEGDDICNVLMASDCHKKLYYQPDASSVVVNDDYASSFSSSSLVMKSTEVAEGAEIVYDFTTSTGIAATPISSEARITNVLDLSGRRLAEPQRGINIIRYSDGTTRKVIVK